MDLERVLRDLGWGRGARAGKFVAYFHLVDACGGSGCPVCRCLRELTLRSLDALLYEQVNDPDTRARLSRSWGFCAWHAWLATEVRNAPLGIAIVYEDLLRQARARLGAAHLELTRAPVARGWRRLFRRATPVELVAARAARVPCPLCVTLAEAEAGYLRTVLDSLEDPEFDGAYGRSDGLCLPHLVLALAAHPGHGGAAALVARALQKLDRLAAELRAFVAKHDYREQAPFSPDEAVSWTRALGFLVGGREIFGHEVSRSPGPAGAIAPPEPSDPHQT
ncbi:MAG: hypothetical protein HYV62_15895 [Candidatus Rokubacteria bacterium]|nr:hypothetical protein [Candidatus Rokubacteria bacterium]